MPRYCFVCPSCGINLEVVRHMEDAEKSWKCTCGKEMQRDYNSEGVRTGGKDYNKPIHSDSLAISPRQRVEHEQTFPEVKLDNQCRPVFENFRQHEKYLEQTGFVKHPKKRKRKGKRIA